MTTSEYQPLDADERRRNLAQLLFFLALAVVVAAATGGLVILTIVFAIVVIVMLHELGHLMTAKWTGMKVTEYFVGFGPRLWSVRRGETEYGVKALPLGGYVKIAGMSNIDPVDPVDEPCSYRAQSFPRRLLVVSAGSIMHFLIAFVLLFVAFAILGEPKFSPPIIGQTTTLENHHSPARDAGLRAGDRIVSVDGHHFMQWDDLPPYIQGRAGKPVIFVVQRHGQELTLTVVPEEIERNGQRIGAVGVLRGSRIDDVDPITGIARAGHELGRETWLTITSVGRLFGPGHLESYANQVTNQTPRRGGVKGADSDRPVSIIGAVGITAQAADASWFYVLILLAGLNVFIGLLNMVPLPPLDGGHVAIAIYERLRSRRGRPYHADASKLIPVAVATLAVLLVLGSTLIWLDIFRPVSLQ